MTRQSDEFEARWSANEAEIRRRVSRFGLSDEDKTFLMAETAARLKRYRRALSGDDKAFVLLADAVAFRAAQRLRGKATAADNDQPVFVPLAGWVEPEDPDFAEDAEDVDLDRVELRAALRRALDIRPEKDERGLLEPDDPDAGDERHLIELRIAVRQAMEGDEFASLPEGVRHAVNLLLNGGSLQGGTYTSTERWIIHEARKSWSLRRWMDGLLGGFVVGCGRLRARFDEPHIAGSLLAAAAFTTMVGGLPPYPAAGADVAPQPNPPAEANFAPGLHAQPSPSPSPEGAAGDPQPLRLAARHAAVSTGPAARPPARGVLSTSVHPRLPAEDDGHVEATVEQAAVAPLSSTTNASVTVRCNTPTRVLACEAVSLAQAAAPGDQGERP